MSFCPRADDIGGDNSAFNRCLTRRFSERLGQFIAYKAAERSLTIAERLAAALNTLFDPLLLPNVSPSLKISQQERDALLGIEMVRIVGRQLRIGVVPSAAERAVAVDFDFDFDLAY